MAQYQSFPGAPGDSMTLDKLKRMAFPELAGKTFLDVGCNEGFFCGFARHVGAARSVGIDRSHGFIARARERFPDCEFHARGWEWLPEGPFDVILLASALHYAEDQEALLHELVRHLTPDGVLVLELGIVTSKESAWVKVARDNDERLFPTMPRLREVFADYAWKWMGPSVTQAGDPVNRHIIHVSPRRRTAYLLMQPPAFGKSSIARSLFPPAGVPVVSGDQVMGRIAAGKLQVAPGLAAAIGDDYSPFRIDQAIERVFDRGLARDLVATWLAEAGERDFALDAYVPATHQEKVLGHLADAGYMPVVLQWDRPGAKLMPQDVFHAEAEAFYLSMTGAGPASGTQAPGAMGFVDEAKLAGGRLLLRGWAVERDGQLPAVLSVRIGDVVHRLDAFEKQLRPDVQSHLGLAHALVGYQASVPAPGISRLSDLAGLLQVHAHDGATGDAFRLAGPLAKKLEGGGSQA